MFLRNIKIQHLTIRRKLALMLLFPIASMLYFSLSGIVEKSRLSSEMARVQNLAALTVQVSALVHELQHEYGMTAGFLGSKGREFSSDLPGQYAATDTKLDAFKAYLQAVDHTVLSRADADGLRTALNDLERLRSIREASRSRNITLSDALGYYTRVNRALLGVVPHIAHASSSGALSRAAAAYSAFLQGKERAGIEQAVLNHTFAAKAFTSSDLLQTLTSLLVEQGTYTQGFFALATREEKEVYTKTMRGKFVDETQRMRNIAVSKGLEGDFGVDPKYWFTMQTGKMQLLKEVDESFSHALVEHAAHLARRATSTLIFFIALTLIAILVTACFVFYVVRGITASLRDALHMATLMADGDLTKRIDVASHDEIGQLMQVMQTKNAKLRQMVSDIQAVSATITSAASEIAQGNIDLSQRTQEQAAALDETASSLEEMTSTVQQNAANAGQANELAAAARQQAENGGTVVDQAVTAMAALNTSSKQIADITGVIDSIAFQTNLLALNAAVEAARAGEQGRGFAVVAAEVRKLAQRSAEAAKEIKALIADSVEKVGDGARLVEASGQKLAEIVTAVKKVSDIVAEIAAASREQALGIEQVNKAVTQMDEATHQNAALVDEMAAASESMDAQAKELFQRMAYFQVDGHQENRPSGASQSDEPELANRSFPGAPRLDDSSEVPARSAGGRLPVSVRAADADDDEWTEF